jgi:hypothetical protein
MRLAISESEAVARYRFVRDEVRTGFPAIWDETIELCANVPTNITATDVWKYGRDKPCWSNILVDIGRRIASDLTLSDDFLSHERIAADDWAIELRSRGPRWRANENFELRGQSVQAFVGRLDRGGLRSYLWRLHSIRNLAIALSRDASVRAMVDELSARQQIPALELERWTKHFARNVGLGWGYVTVYHMLTDMGLSPKPDRHFRRGAIRMGLLEPAVPSRIPDPELDNRAFDHPVALAVIELAQHIDPMAFAANPRSALREVDKVVMEWSRQELARPL